MAGGGGAPSEEEPEDKRAEKPKKLFLDFPIELEFGSRKGKAGYGAAPNKIALGCFTVIIG